MLASVSNNNNYVLYRPSDVHARDKKGRTPFLLACEHARTDLARKLLDAKSGKSAVSCNKAGH